MCKLDKHPILVCNIEKKDIKKFSITNKEFGGEITITIEFAENENGYYKNCENTVNVINNAFNELLNFVSDCLGFYQSNDKPCDSDKATDNANNQNP